MVAFESCSGAKSMDRLIDEDDPDPYEAIARRYLNIGCAIMTPNDCRIELIDRLVEEFHVQGIVEMVLSGCHSAGIESFSMKRFVNEEKHIPYLMIDTAYSAADYGQLNTRIGAFIEMIFDTDGSLGKRLDMDYCYQLAFQAVTKRKSIGSVMEELYQYTKIPMFWDDQGSRQIFGPIQGHNVCGYLTGEIDGGSVVFGVLEGGHHREILEQILELLSQIYFMMKEPEVKGQHLDKEEPDFLCLAFSCSEKEMRRFVEEGFGKHFSVSRWKSLPGGCACLLEKLKGDEARKEVFAYVRDYCSKYKVGIGNLFDDMDDYERETEIVRHFLAAARKIDVQKSVYLIEDYYMEMGCYYAAQILGKEGWRIHEAEVLLKEDQEKGTHLYETLFQYLRNGKNTTQTAKILEIHRNTLLHRISQIQELLGEDLGNEEFSGRVFGAMLLKALG